MRSRKMWKFLLLVLCLSGSCCAGPLGGKKRNVPIVLREDDPMITEPAGSQESDVERPQPEPISPEMHLPATLTLPSNATSIRADITDNFSCDNRAYGYYADVENECQIFHVCLPVTYADGKENTFRWSFICPEETIFSQDSFTCMRREDMTIDCEESVNYYELNQNFGMTDEDKTSNTNSAANEPETSASQTEEQPQPETQSTNEEMPQTAAIPTPAQKQPKPPKPQPPKAPKPNRRKPQPKPQQSAISPTNKLPNIVPLRKVPGVNPIVSANTVSSTEEKQDVKPYTQRFKIRPAVTFSTNQEEAQPVKTETTVTNVETHKRRRPVLPVIKDTTSTKVESEPIVKVTHSVTSSQSVVPTVKLDKPEAIVPPKKEEEAKPVEVPAKTEETISESDALPAASETAEVVVKPEDIPQPIAEETIKNEEKEDTEKTQETETINEPELEKIAEPEKTEITASVAEEAPKQEDMPKTEEVPTVEDDQKPVEALPAVLEETEASKPELESTNNVKSGTATEVEKPAQEPEASKPITEEEKPSETMPQISAESADPAIFASNSEEAGSTLEELEEAKPVDAIETVPATVEMEHQDPTVEQILAENDEHMHTVGGFKPVDPALAAEAEALITDFLNTLKSDTRPMVAVPMAEEMPMASMEIEDVKSAEVEKTDESEEMKLKADTPKEPSEQPIEAEKEQKLPETEEAEPKPMENGAPMPNVLMMNSFPGDMYQIPVKVIQTPVEMAQKAEQAEAVKIETEEKEKVNEVEQPASAPEAVPVAYKPISIDDIVELVKERLDQVPANEKGTPMELVMEPMPSVEIKPVESTPEQLKLATAEASNEAPQQSAEDIIFPIYHRVSEVNSNLVKSNAPEIEEPSAEVEVPAVVVEQKLSELTANDKELPEPAPLTVEKSVQTDDSVIKPTETETETKEKEVMPVLPEARNKINRIYRSRSLNKAKMDPRKRQFLFKSDAS